MKYKNSYKIKVNISSLELLKCYFLRELNKYFIGNRHRLLHHAWKICLLGRSLLLQDLRVY